MRALVALVLLVGCGGDDPADPHVVGSCSGWVDNQGNPFSGQCEAACTMPPASSGMACDTTAQLNCPSFEFDGSIDGCCIEQGGTIRFFECVP